MDKVEIKLLNINNRSNLIEDEDKKDPKTLICGYNAKISSWLIRFYIH